MTLTLELPEGIENYLEKEAAKQGLSPSEYALRALLRDLDIPAPAAAGGPRPFYETASHEEWVRAFREWAASHDQTTPPIPLEALRRENMYDDRGL